MDALLTGWMMGVLVTFVAMLSTYYIDEGRFEARVTGWFALLALAWPITIPTVILLLTFERLPDDE